jgi:Ran-binding protein 3
MSNKVSTSSEILDKRTNQNLAATGEEAEETMFSCRAKLFHFEKEWKERGVGTVKLNIHYAVKEDPAEAPEQRARLIMRTDGVHRVVLNTPVFKGMKFGTPECKEPNGKTLNLTGMENGKPALFLLKVSLLKVKRHFRRGTNRRARLGKRMWLKSSTKES